MIKSPTAPRRRTLPTGPSVPRRRQPPDEFDAWLDQRLREIFALPDALPDALPAPPAPSPPEEAD